jgi:hypothetical protein
MASCIDYAEYVQQVFSRNSNLLYGPIGQALRTKTPWLSVFKGGTFPAQVASTLLAVAQGRTKMAANMAAPTFNSMLGTCGAVTSIDQNGTNQWSYSAEIGSGTSEQICMNVAFSAFKESLISEVSAYQEGVTQLIAADTRWQTFLRSGVKAVVQSATTADGMIVGGENQIDVPVPAIESDGRLDISTLQAFNRIMRTNYRATPFGSGGGMHARLLASPETLTDLLTDLGGGAPANANIMPFGALAAGGDNMAVNALKSYLFEPLYRGIQYGEDTIDLRLNWNGSGYDPVDPDTADSATAGTVAVTNPAWIEASHTVSFLIFEGAFIRQVPEQWTGEGKVRFDRQMYGGEIQFINNKDMTCNPFGDWGVLAYRVGRALKPVRPWFVLPIISKRCFPEPSVETCTGVSGE